MRRIVVTPAGREPYLRLLHKCLMSQRDDFDEWHLWMNTSVPEDVAYCQRLVLEHPEFIKAVQLPQELAPGASSISWFYRGCTDPDAMYMKVDDDVVWMEPGFVGAMFKDLIEMDTDKHFMLFPAIVNNAVISHIFQKNGALKYPQQVKYRCLDAVGWYSRDFAMELHKQFIRAISTGKTDAWKFEPRVLEDYPRVSINCIGWHGSEFAKFGGIVIMGDDEQWLSVVKPHELGKPNLLTGRHLCVHFAFYTQRPFENEADLLEAYEDLIRK